MAFGRGKGVCDSWGKNQEQISLATKLHERHEIRKMDSRLRGNDKKKAGAAGETGKGEV